MHNLPLNLLKVASSDAIIYNFSVILNDESSKVYYGNLLRINILGKLRFIYNNDLCWSYIDTKTIDVIKNPEERSISFSKKSTEFTTMSNVEMRYKILFKYKKDYDTVISRI
jgi:hypothetical protein